ncbi:MAG: cyclic nucleotide-binding domain-containing protein [Sandaracinus sp.]|nr:cyclic nucleotide-binding domain-containing protein [Sandaracinus sp.]MCB9631700.1 cyclic nucleotide-binding domain-containing protein [Sandaracinus sp.]
MALPPTLATTSPIDRAHAARLRGDLDGALQLAIALLERDPTQLAAASLLTTTLVAEDRGLVAGEASLRLVDAFVRRGDLPQALGAALSAKRAGDDATPLFASIAEAFGKGSKRVTDVSPSPPPLPEEVAVPKELDATKGDALLDRAERALEKWLATDDPLGDDTELPRLPLFGDLEPKALASLLAAFTLRDVAPDAEVVAQGEEGTEAFVVTRGMLRVVRRDGSEELTLAILGPGAIFGEMALVSEAPRAAAVVAGEAAALLVIAREALEKVAAKTPIVGQMLSSFCRQRMLSNLLRHSAILRAVDASHREALIGRFETKHFEAGHALVEEGAESDGLYLIASGAVEVVGKDADGDELRIAELGPGDVVGEISLVLRRPANATVRALHPTVALELTRDELHKVIKTHPTLLAELYELATQREEETRSVVAQEAFDVEDVVLL